MSHIELRRMLRNLDSQDDLRSWNSQNHQCMVCTVNLREHEAVYHAPLLSDLERLIYTGDAIFNHFDEVWPNLYLGDAWIAKNKPLLHELGITHILNVAHGSFNVNTGSDFYCDLPIYYYGIEAYDDPCFDLSPFFTPAASFIKAGMDFLGGKVLVNCGMGISRAASIVIAYLMIHENMSLIDAIKVVTSKRNINPNKGFLEQLIELEKWLHQRRTQL
ncbi:dual specificity protein phosphatase 13B-like isoform X1 [Mixophyes fleayi]|uniref:dual specificity protein phosphatase 13B-like isoform X1 n=1 Tax=Mixophyes fleayi TaxID=3061075 RepID=UPI003F4D9032